MQIKIVNIPMVGGESLIEEMNVFLRSKRILQTESHIVTGRSAATEQIIVLRSVSL
ncbi:MAG: hypothetical protein U5L45_02405 [Saprospiraceae bacterium]|nr:hypothetical protein [Saprospiraceae bacterium]